MKVDYKNSTVTLRNAFKARFIPIYRKRITIKFDEIGPVNPALSTKLSNRHDCLVTTEGRIFVRLSESDKALLEGIFEESNSARPETEKRKFRKALYKISASSLIAVLLLLSGIGYGLYYYFVHFLPNYFSY